MLRRWSVLCLALVLASACQVRLASDVTVERDGSGTFAFEISLDEEMTTALQDAGMDPLQGLEEASAAAPEWEVVRQPDADGGVGVRLRASFDDPSGFQRLASELNAALDQDDLRVHEDLRLERRDSGALAVSGRVGLRLPAAPGAEGVGVGFDADDLQRLLEERGDEFVRYDVRVTLPAAPVRHDADEVDGNSLVWHAPLGEMRTISAVSADPGPPPLLIAALIALGAAVVAFVAVLVWRRRSGPSTPVV